MARSDRFLKALRGEPVDTTPVWIMRQAGRYLPEYRATRAKAGDFLTLCKTPELACEVTLQPIDRLGVDAAILFSDILIPLETMGIPLGFPDEGPRLQPVRDEAAIRALRVPDAAAELPFVMEAVRLIRRALDGKVPLIGFAGRAVHAAHLRRRRADGQAVRRDQEAALHGARGGAPAAAEADRHRRRLSRRADPRRRAGGAAVRLVGGPARARRLPRLRRALRQAARRPAAPARRAHHLLRQRRRLAPRRRRHASAPTRSASTGAPRSTRRARAPATA